MRITGGELGGRKVLVPQKEVRPALDRVREAVFSSLGEYVIDSVVLDLFAGSGAYGLEAWSRGAAKVTWVEDNGPVLKVLHRNVNTLCGEDHRQLRVVRADVWKWMERGAIRGVTLVFADPPYDYSRDEKQLEKVLFGLEQGSVLSAGGILVYEQGAREYVVTDRAGWSLLRDKKYGKSRLLMYRREDRI